MSAKKKKGQAAQSEAEDPKALRIAQEPTESSAEAMAHASLRPTVQAALTLRNYNSAFGELSISTLVEDLGVQCQLASRGNLARAEAMLVAQAHSLDAIFHKLARKASQSEYLNQLEVYLRLALKAQSQSRATLETLAEIKNPMAGAYVQQANIAAGHQQVNNSIAQSSEPTRAGETKKQQSKQSGGDSELP